MVSQRILYECCHEAGHVVAGVINRDRMLLVIGHAGAIISDEQRQVYEQRFPSSPVRPATLSERRDLCCECGGRTRRTEVSLGARRFYPGARLCGRCLDFITKEVAVISAGGVAASILVPSEHNPLRSREDGNEVNTFLAELEEKERAIACKKGRLLAEKWMREESKAVLAVAGVLQERVLDGAEATRIVQENLRASHRHPS